MDGNKELFAAIREHRSSLTEAVAEYFKCEAEVNRLDRQAEAEHRELLEREQFMAKYDQDKEYASHALAEEQGKRIGDLFLHPDDGIVTDDEALTAFLVQNVEKCDLPVDVKRHLAYGAWDYRDECMSQMRELFVQWVGVVRAYVLAQPAEWAEFERLWEGELKERTDAVSRQLTFLKATHEQLADNREMMSMLIEEHGRHFEQMVKERVDLAGPQTSREPKPKPRITTKQVEMAKVEAKKMVAQKSAVRPANKEGYVSPFVVRFTAEARAAHLTFHKLVPVNGKKPGIEVHASGTTTIIYDKAGWEKEVARLAEKLA